MMMIVIGMLIFFLFPRRPVVDQEGLTVRKFVLQPGTFGFDRVAKSDPIALASFQLSCRSTSMQMSSLRIQTMRTLLHSPFPRPRA
jgi:hypothetical protein